MGAGGPERALVIVNLQRTPLDKQATHRFFARCDDVLAGLMSELKLPIPAYTPRPLPIVMGYRGKKRAKLPVPTSGGNGGGSSGGGPGGGKVIGTGQGACA